MSTNCLLTKLKGVVDNSNLKKFGYWYVNIPNAIGVDSGIGVSVFETDKPVVAVSEQNQLTMRGQTTVIPECSYASTVPDGNQMVRTNATKDVITFTNKYNIKDLLLRFADENGGIDNSILNPAFEQLKYNGIKTIAFQAVNGNNVYIDVLKPILPSLTSLRIAGGGIFGDTSVLKDTTTLTVFKGEALQGTTIINPRLEGSIMDLTNNLNLTTLSVGACPLMTPIEVKDFVLAQISKGRSSGNIEFIPCYYPEGNVIYTFNGENLTIGHYVLSWTGADNITIEKTQ